MSEEDLTKEEKLEAARKKFEELKKNKKKTKKNKKKNANETPELGTETETETATESNNDAAKLEEEKSVGKTDAIDEEKNESTQVKVEPESEVAEEEGEKDEKEKNEPIEQTSKIEDDYSNRKQLHSNDISVVKPESEKVGKLVDEIQEKDKTTVEKKIERNEPIIERNIEETIVSQDNSNETKDTYNEPGLEELLSKETADEESTFLTETLKSTITQLKSENQELHSEISKLKSDNLDLKMTKMDLEMELETTKNELETQKEQVKRLTHQLVLTKTVALHPIKSNEDDGISVLSGTEYLHNTTSSFQNLTNFNINNTSQDYLDIVDVKERLQQWTGWNMDMHGWRSIGMGPVFEA
jgi:hypothetical protein